MLSLFLHGLLRLPMARYRRRLCRLSVFFGATFLIFAMVYLMPGDPVAALGGDKGLDPAVQERIRAEYNLDKPFWMQYLLYIKGVFTLDFGQTFSGRPVAEVMARHSPQPSASHLWPLPLRLSSVLSSESLLAFARARFSIPLFLSSPCVSQCPPSSWHSSQFFVGVGGTPSCDGGAKVEFRCSLMPAMVLSGVSLAYVIRLTRQSISKPQVLISCVPHVLRFGNGSVMTRHILRSYSRGDVLDLISVLSWAARSSPVFSISEASAACCLTASRRVNRARLSRSPLPWC